MVAGWISLGCTALTGKLYPKPSLTRVVTTKLTVWPDSGCFQIALNGEYGVNGFLGTASGWLSVVMPCAARLRRTGCHRSAVHSQCSVVSVPVTAVNKHDNNSKNNDDSSITIVKSKNIENNGD